MTKEEQVERIAEDAGITKADADRAYDSLVRSITRDLRLHGDAKISGLGRFEVRSRSARTGRNPQTGETIQIAASRTVGFKPITALKDEVNFR